MSIAIHRGEEPTLQGGSFSCLFVVLVDKVGPFRRLERFVVFVDPLGRPRKFICYPDKVTLFPKIVGFPTKPFSKAFPASARMFDKPRKPFVSMPGVSPPERLHPEYLFPRPADRKGISRSRSFHFHERIDTGGRIPRVSQGLLGTAVEIDKPFLSAAFPSEQGTFPRSRFIDHRLKSHRTPEESEPHDTWDL